jgi:hypothetical protein
MKPAKPASATMNEQTFVPATMRAVYYDQIRTGDEVLAGANYTKKYREIDAGLAIGAFLDGILQRRGRQHINISSRFKQPHGVIWECRQPELLTPSMHQRTFRYTVYMEL